MLKTTSRQASGLFVCLGVLLDLAQPAAASGFFISQQSVEGIGRATAGNAALARDASTVFFNPAGLTRLQEPQLVTGISLISPRVSIDNKGSTAATPGTLGAPVPFPGGGGGNTFERGMVPNAYFAYPVPGDRLWLGLGLSAPFGLTTRAPKGWFGRYDSLRSGLATVDFAPSAALRINDMLSLGGGIDIQYAQATLASAVPNPLAPGGPSAATDGRNRLQGDDWSVGFNIGVLITPRQDTRFGLHYRSAVTQRLDGHYDISELTGPLATFNGRFAAHADLDLPDIVSLAVAHEVSPGLTLAAEYQWFNWSRFREVRARYSADQPDVVVPQHYEDSFAVAIGGEYALSTALTVRGGFRYEQTPTRNRFRTTTVPEGDNYSLGVGLSYAVCEGVLLDLGAFATLFDNADIDLERQFFAGTPAESRVNIKAEAEMVSATVALGLRMAF